MANMMDGFSRLYLFFALFAGLFSLFSNVLSLTFLFWAAMIPGPGFVGRFRVCQTLPVSRCRLGRTLWDGAGWCADVGVLQRGGVFSSVSCLDGLGLRGNGDVFRGWAGWDGQGMSCEHGGLVAVPGAAMLGCYWGAGGSGSGLGGGGLYAALYVGMVVSYFAGISCCRLFLMRDPSSALQVRFPVPDVVLIPVALLLIGWACWRAEYLVDGMFRLLGGKGTCRRCEAFQTAGSFFVSVAQQAGGSSGLAVGSVLVRSCCRGECLSEGAVSGAFGRRSGIRAGGDDSVVEPWRGSGMGYRGCRVRGRVRALPLSRGRLALERMGFMAGPFLVVALGLAGPFWGFGLWGCFDTVLASSLVALGFYLLIGSGDTEDLPWWQVGPLLGVFVAQAVIVWIGLSGGWSAAVIVWIGLSGGWSAAVFRVGEVALGLVVLGVLAGVAFVRMRASILSNSGLYRPVKGRAGWLGWGRM